MPFNVVIGGLPSLDGENIASFAEQVFSRALDWIVVFNEASTLYIQDSCELAHAHFQIADPVLHLHIWKRMRQLRKEKKCVAFVEAIYTCHALAA